jgi:hypothetical protein
MMAAQEIATPEGQGAPSGFDEAFLQRMDRAMLQHKQSDPYRLERAARAAEEEAHIAGLHKLYDLETKRERLA